MNSLNIIKANTWNMNVILSPQIQWESQLQIQVLLVGLHRQENDSPK